MHICIEGVYTYKFEYMSIFSIKYIFLFSFNFRLDIDMSVCISTEFLKTIRARTSQVGHNISHYKK